MEHVAHRRSWSTCWILLVLLLVLPTLIFAEISAEHAGFTESIKLAELPSPKCLWMKLPHAVQVAILLGMVVLLFRVNRFFDKLDEASYARLSRAVSGLAKVRERAANRQTQRH